MSLTLYELLLQLPEELQEESSTGRDLMDNIILEARKQERERITHLLQFDSLKFRMSSNGDYEIWLTNGQWQALK